MTDDKMDALSSFHDFQLFIERASHLSIRDAVQASLSYWEEAINDPKDHMSQDLEYKTIGRIWQLRAFLEIFDLLKQPQPGLSIEDRTTLRDREAQIDLSAYSLGFTAGSSGLVIDQCPYLQNTRNHEEWIKGWKKGMETAPVQGV
jgi:ribosome modulation factor